MNNFLILVLFLAATACQSTPETSSQAMAELDLLKLPAPKQTKYEEIPLPLPPQIEKAKPSVPTNRQLIRNAQLRIRVSEFKSSGRVIEKAIQQAGGQIANSNETKTENSIENALTIRVPAAQLDALIVSILKESIFTDTKTITTEDATRRYVDTEARIRSKKAVEDTYLTLLKQARNVGDVLKIEERLGQIREKREAGLRQLKDEVALSTINLTYYQQTDVAMNPKEPFYTQIWHNLADGCQLMGDALIGLFYFLPLGLVGTGIVLLFQRWRRKRISDRIKQD